MIDEAVSKLATYALRTGLIEKFQALCAENPQKATDWYYKFSQDTNYIRRDRIAKDMQ